MATEKRLIDANKVAQDIRENNLDNFKKTDWTSQDVCTLLENAPTVDAVEVVRCKDCVCYEETCHGYGYCYHWDYEQGMSPNQAESDDFCSYGERRTDVQP